MDPSAQCAGLVPWRDVKGSHGFDEQIFGANEQIPEPGQTYLGGTVSSCPSDDRLLLILRRLDEIERKLDHMLDELWTPTAIGYSARRGNRPRND